jgi:amidase
MQLADYVEYDALGLAELVRKGETNARELADLALAALARVNPAIGAVVETWPEDVPALIDQAPAGAAFSGVPFLIKDAVLHMAGKACEYGSRMAAGLVAGEDSALMARFRAAGLVALGRTASPELALSPTTEPVFYGATRNPWDLSRSAGGSSGGAAAAVAAGVVPLAHANDGAAPSAFRRHAAAFWSQAHARQGFHRARQRRRAQRAGCRTGGEPQRARQRGLARCGAGPCSGRFSLPARPLRPYRDEVGRDPGRLRIGFLPWGLGERKADPVVAAGVEAVARTLEDLGHEVEPASIDPGIGGDEFRLLNARIWAANAASWIDAFAAATGRPIDGSTLEEITLSYYRFGRTVTAVDLLGAFEARNRMARRFAAWFAGHDVLVMPTLPTLPYETGAYARSLEGLRDEDLLVQAFRFMPYTPLFNVTGQPAMSMPLVHDAASGLPVGIQFAAGLCREDVLLRLAGQLEQAMPWAGRRPPVWAGIGAKP